MSWRYASSFIVSTRIARSARRWRTSGSSLAGLPLRLRRARDAQQALRSSMLRARRRGEHVALVAQRRVGDLPAVVELADQVLARHAHVLEEHLVEAGVAGHLHERADGDARASSCRSGCRRCRGASARRDRCARGRTSSRRTARSTSRSSGRSRRSRRRTSSARVLQRRQVGARARLGVALAPDLLGASGSSAGSGASAPRCRAR